MRAKQWRQGLLTGVLLLVALWLGTLIWGLVGKARIAVNQAHDANAEYASLEARKTTLEKNLNSLGTPLGQDAAIRQAFGVAKPGEEVIVVVPPANAATTENPSWWERVLKWF